jgi:hypothetical protein
MARARLEASRRGGGQHAARRRLLTVLLDRRGLLGDENGRSLLEGVHDDLSLFVERLLSA